MIQVEFAERAVKVLKTDKDVIGLAVAGSWLTNKVDEFSDLDLILVTANKISDSKDTMLDYARRLGTLLSGFTGEHVGEPRILICLYDNPLLHVDIKFLTISEFHTRVETPAILFDTDGHLQDALNNSSANYPYPDYQWIEDRFWVWVHYALLKIGRGEYLEAFDFFGFLRMVVFGPLLHIKNGNLPRGVRKVETELNMEDLLHLKQTIPVYERQALLDSLRHAVTLYRMLRIALYKKINLQKDAEEMVMKYLEEIQAREK